MKKKLYVLTLSVLMCISLAACGNKGADENSQNNSVESQATDTAEAAADNTSDGTGEASDAAGTEKSINTDALKKMAGKPAITIVYTNDVHTYMNNKKVDEEGNERRQLTYGSVAAIRKEHISNGETVFLVDAGDNVQGSAYGGFDKGSGAGRVMAATGYDVAAVGNHEFDYGMQRALEIFDHSSFPYISCNFCYADTGECVLPAYQIIEKDGVRVAFIGITTPETITKSSPKYFRDENGKMIYDFCQGNNGQDLYDRVQATVDEVAPQADYVIALSHLGNMDGSAPFRSSDVLRHTRGIDAFIDGHSHLIMQNQKFTNLDGKKVTITQTGSYLETIGVMTISDSGVTTELIANYREVDEKAIAASEIVVDAVNAELNKVIAVNENPLYINDAMDSKTRLVRRMGTNMSDLVSDSVYWYVNDEIELDCDIAVTNGGGIRTDIKKGDFSYLSAANVLPFGNVICLVKVTGQQVKDMLEWSTRDLPDKENGGLLHAAGVTFNVNTSIDSTVQGNESKEFTGPPTGEYRVCDIKVYNRKTQKYEDLDLEKTYTVAGNNYILRDGGEGFTMLNESELVVDNIYEDYLVLAEYVKAFGTSGDEIPHINNANTPLEYKDYVFNYESPLGSYRMSVFQ